MKTLLVSIFLFLGICQISAQSELYFVSSETAFLRSGPGTTYTVVAELSKSMQVTVISDEFGEYWTVQYKTMNGFIKRDNLIAIVAPTVSSNNNDDDYDDEYEDDYDNDNGGSTTKDKYEDWDTTEYETGETPECLNIVPEFDYNMDNFLKITNDGSDTEAVVKLIKLDNQNGEEITYRIAFIKAGDIHTMKNVPGGKYYLKIAYGQEWKETNLDGNCTGKFTVNPQYEKGGDIVDFYPIKTSAGTEIPNYQLTLDVEHSGNNNLSTDDISEEEFNND